MSNDVSTFENNPLYSGYSHGMNLGHPMLNLAAMFMLHGNQMPQRRSGQDTYDAFIQQERSMDMMKLQSGSFMNNQVFQRLGIGGNNPAITALSMGGAFSPDSMLGRVLTPALGGNPMAATMRAYTGLAGASTMGSFGRIDNLSAGETQSVMNSVADNFYNHQRYESSDAGGTGHQERLRVKTQDYLNTQLDTIAQKPGSAEAKRSIKNLKAQGFNFEERGQDSGIIDEGVHSELKKKIASFDVTDGPAPDMNSVTQDAKALMHESDQQLKKALSERLKKQLFAFQTATKGEIDAAAAPNGLLDPGKVAALVARQVTGKAPTTGTAQEEEKKVAVRDNLLTELTSIENPATTPQQRQAKKEASAALLTKIQSTYGLNEETKKTLTLPDGSLDTQKAAAYIATRSAGNVAGSDEQRQAKKEIDDAYEENVRRRKTIDSNIAERRGAAGIYTSDLADVAKMSVSVSETDEPDKEKREAKIKELVAAKNAAGEELLTKIKGTYNMSDADIKELKSPAGNIDIGKTRAALEASRRLTTIEAIKQESDVSAKAGGTYAGINFQNTRGFTIEDITSGFTKAADLRMLGNIKGMRPADVAGEFTRKAGGALDASRAVFGDDLTGGEHVQRMSALAGTSAVDMLDESVKVQGVGGQEQHISKMESMLRDVKSTSRVAGVSINTMLGIIDSAKELISNNPRIRNMNSAAVAKMSVDAINKAADMSSSMGARDYREFGGSQEQTAREIQEKTNFASSGLGGFGAALLAKAGEGTEEYAKLQEYFKSGGLTATALGNGGIQKIADILHTTTGDVNQIGSNKLLQRDAMKQEGVVNTLNEIHTQTAVKSFWDYGKGRGLDEQREKAGFKEYMKNNPKGSVEEYFNMHIKERLGTVGQSIYDSQQQTIKMDFLDSLRSEPEKARYKAALSEDKARSIELSQKYAGANAPVLTQAISALAEGKDFKGTAQALSGIFAISKPTNKDVTPAQQAAMNNAAAAGEDLGKILSTTKGRSEAFKAGALEDINKLNAGIKAAALLDAEKAGGDATAEGKIKKQTAEKLGDVTKEELDDLAKYGPNLGYNSAKEAEGAFNDLTEKQRAGTISATERTQLKQLQTISKITGFRSDKAVALAQRGDLGNVGASMIQGQKDAIAEDQIRESKKQRTEALTKTLDTLGAEQSTGNATEIAAAREYFKDKGGDEAMLAQWKDQSVGGKDNYFANKKDAAGKAKDWGGLGQALGGTAAAIERDTAAARIGAGDKPPTAEEKSKKELIDALGKLTTALNSGQAVGAISNLADALLR